MKEKITALYERLSRDDEQQGESNSIVNQKKYFTGPEDRIVRVSDRANEKVNKGMNVHVNDCQKELLSFLVEDSGYTVSQLSEKMQVSRKTIAGHLKVLKDKGIIERIGSA
ncbi:MAG: ArsR family transcriptional regulator, partial [Clostridia bacterium]|nr:ArsR family transcriptional regulator [Clostridia bacterium]